MRKAISKKLRFEVFKRDSFKCQYCGNSSPDVILHVDHINPVAKGGDNHITNLVTSCQSCNLGKGARTLDDNSVVAKQKEQMDAINEKRVQLEMMMKWRSELKDIESQEINMAVDEWNSYISPQSLSDYGVTKIRGYLQKYGFTMLIEAMDIASKYIDSEGSIESKNTACDKIGGICRNKSKPQWEQDLNYICSIARRMHNYYDFKSLMNILSSAYKAGVTIDRLTAIVKGSFNWSDMTRSILQATNNIPRGFN